MRIIIDIATILGGIAALLYFQERISSYRALSRQTVDREVRQDTKVKRPTFTSESLWRICGAITSLIFGAIGWLLAVKIGFVSIVITMFIFLAAFSIVDKLQEGEPFFGFEFLSLKDKCLRSVAGGMALSAHTAIIGSISVLIFDMDKIVAIALGAFVGLVLWVSWLSP